MELVVRLLLGKGEVDAGGLGTERPLHVVDPYADGHHVAPLLRDPGPMMQIIPVSVENFRRNDYL